MSRARPVSHVRIIAGSWRGRKIAFPPVEGLRPTPDRVRETLFNWLSPVVPGARCLDLYAGSGVLGFEAASRGAADVVMVENNRAVAECLRDQRRQLAADQVTVAEMTVDDWLSGKPSPFDIVFLDPPFRENLLPGVIDRLESRGWLADEAWIYLESEKGLALELPATWRLHRSKQAGQVAYRLAHRSATA